ncbi:SMP-30/gluconolactonase/LRE family protein [Pseudidiomarina insulisalsae]|uniref:Gluconolactonase n=1 Tax=Pseudidiomarina insulisalsae TaxID=575789 RepID=A0A432YI22_9GAMM|nr:SMP-30/gluconolactonase/LRE family protein [Pseudidiomarina insulisalsae]RUO60603.1 gluconolactonase [Pseudidiomarina insulisalsae]
MQWVLISLVSCAMFVASATTAAHDIEVISDGHSFTEGPLWHDGELWFSDIPTSTIYRWHPERGSSIAVRPSSGANGLALDTQNRLLMAQHQARRIARLNSDGTQTSLASHFQGKRLNSPNDLVVADNGAIYFTDPPFAVSEEEQELDFAGVFKISNAGELIVLDDALARPNGIILSPDATTLYVTDAYQWQIFAYDVTPEGVANKRLFAELEGTYEQGMDGMAVAQDGTLYVAGPQGIYAYSAQGKLLELIELPDFTANVALVETDNRVLYVTNQTEVLKISLSANDTD